MTSKFHNQRERQFAAVPGIQHAEWFGKTLLAKWLDAANKLGGKICAHVADEVSRAKQASLEVNLQRRVATRPLGMLYTAEESGSRSEP